MARGRWIIVGTDFSPAADCAVDRAAELASELGASLAVVHAFEDRPDAQPEDDLTAVVQARLEESASLLRARHPSIHIDCVVRRGTPWDKLANVACDFGAEMIVVGAGGEHSADAPRFLGRVVTRVATTSDCAVLVIPARATSP